MIEKDPELARIKLVKDIFTSLFNKNHLELLLNTNLIDYDFYNHRMAIFNSSIPLKMSGLKNVLVNLGFFEIDPNKPHILFITTEFHIFFEDVVLPWMFQNIESLTQNELSYDQFLQIQELKDEAGLLAEEFVYEYEKRRLKGHPQLENVKIISRIDIRAGYDIISFDSLESRDIDRFIEVKSYSRTLGFFFTKNEIRNAELKRKQYYIYLVDRSHLQTEDYNPQIIQDPFISVIQDEKWKKNPQSWFITR